MSNKPFSILSRRTFMSLPLLVPMAALARTSADEYHFHRDHILGTSLDLTVVAGDSDSADRAADAVLNEIARLIPILNTRDPESEISLLDLHHHPSRDLLSVLSAYAHWEQKTDGVLTLYPQGKTAGRNVDALGKAYILDRALLAARQAAPEVNSIRLNIGGDIRVDGKDCTIAVTNPHQWQDNAEPLTQLQLRNVSIATSGAYARGAHLIDGRTGLPVARPATATVVAPDSIIANALATALCVMGSEEASAMLKRMPGVAAMRIDPNGTILKTAEFVSLERPMLRKVAMLADWPAGFQLNISLTLTNGAPAFGGRGGFGGFGGRGGFSQPQYLAIWIEDNSGKLVRVLAFLANKPRYYNELSTFYTVANRNQLNLGSLARATRRAGHYDFVWDGLDQQQKAVPPGVYRVTVETNQEHGTYAKQTATIECIDKPSMTTLPATSNFEAVAVEFGPKPKTA